MFREAAQAGFYTPNPVDYPGEKHPKLQILTIEDLLNGRRLEYPRKAPEATFKKAQHKGKKSDEQKGLFSDE